MRVLSALAAACLCLGCYPRESGPAGDGPGTEAWGDPNVLCEADSDCLASEMCLEGVCQLKRCHNGPYPSEPPIGRNLVFLSDREIAVAERSFQGGYRVRGYRTDAAGASYQNAWNIGAGPVHDVAGGNFFEGRPEEFVAAVSGRTQVKIWNTDVTEWLDVGLAPVAVAAGDLDNDGVDEVFALSETGDIAICSTVEGACLRYGFDGGVRGVDLAAGDLDRDGRPEAVALIEVQGSSQLVVVNPDHEETGQPLSYGVVAPETLHRVAAGDLDGDLTAEIVALRDSGCFLGCGDDKVFFYQAQDSALLQLGQWTVNDDVIDVEVGDIDMDDRFEVVLLRDDPKVRVLRMSSPTAFTQLFETWITADESLGRLALSDFDGDSPAGKLVSGPELVAGRPVPLFAAFYPPYWRELSKTPANVYVGNSELTTETMSDTLSLSAGIELGVDADLLGLFKAGLSTKLRTTVENRFYERHVRFVGNRVWTQADPDLYGPQYAAVLLSYTCSHVYTYQMDDPMARTGNGHGKEFVMVVPVDGGTALLSSMRYNALADALGGLPRINIPHTIGDPTTYPRTMVTIDGDPIEPDDLVVPNPPSYMVSDVGFLGFWLALWDMAGSEASLRTDVSINGSAGVPGFKFGSELGAGWGKSYSIEVGKEAVFGANLPTLPDDPSTPEDEFATYGYSFAPIVYRQRYTDHDGNEAAFYVFHYMVGLP